MMMTPTRCTECVQKYSPEYASEDASEYVPEDASEVGVGVAAHSSMP